MSIQRSGRFQLSRLACLALGSCLAVTAVGQEEAGWQYGIIADVGIAHTDNLFLLDTGFEEAETVFTVAPEFFIRKNSDRTTVDFSYRPEAYFYNDFSDADDIYHVLDANLTQALIDDRFFLNARANSFQTIAAPDAIIFATNLPISANRIDSTVLELRPSWEQRFGSVELYADAAYRDLGFDDETLFQSAQETSGTFELNNFTRQQGFAWGTEYNFRRITYDATPPFEYQRAGINLGFWISDTLRIFAVGGLESSFDDYFDPEMDAEFFEAGLQYAQGTRLNLEIAGGERGYGDAYRGRLDMELRRGSFTINYTETPTTRADVLFQNAQVTADNTVDDFLNRPGNADRFIRKRGDVQLSLDLAKSSLTLSVYSEDLQERTTALGQALGDESMVGGEVRWNWRFGNKTNLILGATLAERDTPTGSDDLALYDVAVEYQLSRRVQVIVQGLRADQNAQSGLGFNYEELQGRLLFRIQVP